MKKQILGRIAANTEFRKYDKISLQLVARALGILDDLRRVVAHGTNRKIHLRQGKLYPISSHFITVAKVPRSVSAAQYLQHFAAEFSRRANGCHSGRIQRFELVCGRALAAGNDCTGMPHAFARRRGNAGDIGNDGF